MTIIFVYACGCWEFKFSNHSFSHESKMKKKKKRKEKKKDSLLRLYWNFHCTIHDYQCILKAFLQKAKTFIFLWKKLRLFLFGRFEKNLAAEAFRRNENDFQKALDDLTNPETNLAIQVGCFLHETLLIFNFIGYVAIIDYAYLQLDIESRKRKQQSADARIKELVSMGFDRSRGNEETVLNCYTGFYLYFSLYNTDSIVARVDILVN